MQPERAPSVVVRAAAVARRHHRRGLGTGIVAATASERRTVLTTVRADSPLKLIQPVFHGTTSAAVCVVTFGGGLVDGDRIELDIVVERGATLVAFTQSSTKVFRGASSQIVRAKVDGTLVWLPDPVAAFGSSRYTQRIDVDLGPSGACVLLDGFTAGRAAFGERWVMNGLDLRTRITHEGRTVLNDALRLDDADGSIVERAGPYDAFATLVAVGSAAHPVIQAIEREPVAPPNGDLAVATSALPRARALGVPGAIARVCAARPMGALAAVRSRLRNLPEMDAVDPFASRY
jgi:urease accessory protein